MALPSSLQSNPLPIDRDLGRLHALDGVRAVCAIGVLFQHHGRDIKALDHPVLQGIFEHLFLALGPFFVLSGYLITDRYYRIEKRSLKAYFLRRAARVFPLLILITTAAFAVHAATGNIPRGQLLPLYLVNISTLKGWFDELKFTGIVQTWSLTPEIAFYGLAPLLFLGMRRVGALFLVFVPLMLMTSGALLVAICAGRAPWGFMGSNEFLFAYTYFGRATEFTVGMALAWLFRRSPQTIGRVPLTLIGTLFTLAGFFWMVWWDLDYTDATGVVVANVVWPILGLGPLFLGLLTEQTRLRQVLSSRILQTMGRSSYAFYLLHLGVAYSVLYALTGSFPITVLCLLFSAWCLHTYVEEPVVRWTRLRWPL